MPTHEFSARPEAAGDHDSRWRWRQLVWLAYLPLILLDAALSHTSTREWILLIVSMLMVAVLVARAVRELENSLLPLVGFTLGLGLLLAPTNFAAVIFFAYAAGAAAHYERPSVAVLLIGLVVAAASIDAWVVHEVFLFSTGAVLASFVGLVNLHFASYRRGNVALMRANAEIERLAAVAERERIARDLHDVLGHTLSLITLKSELAARLAETAAPAAAAESREVQEVSRAALAEIRRVVRGYRTRLSDEVGRARALLEAARVDADIVVDFTDLSIDEEETLAFALREGVTNVVRHAAASECHARLRIEDSAYVLEIEDDGAGVRAPEGNGLRGMRERFGALGGNVSLDSSAGRTRLDARLPRRANGATVAS